MPAISGHHARVIIGNTNWRASRWSVDWKVDDFDTTTFENFDVGIYTPGISDFTLSLDAFWDTSENPFAAPLSLIPGETVYVTIQFDKDATLTAAEYQFPNVLVVDFRTEGSVRDVLRCSLTGKVSAYTEGEGFAGIVLPTNS